MANKKLLISLSVSLLFCSTLLSAQVMPDKSTGTLPDTSFIFHYPACIQMFKADYKSNRQTLREFGKYLQTFAKGKDTLYVKAIRVGASSRNATGVPPITVATT